MCSRKTCVGIQYIVHVPATPLRRRGWQSLVRRPRYDPLEWFTRKGHFMFLRRPVIVPKMSRGGLSQFPPEEAAAAGTDEAAAAAPEVGAAAALESHGNKQLALLGAPPAANGTHFLILLAVPYADRDSNITALQKYVIHFHLTHMDCSQSLQPKFAATDLQCRVLHMCHF